MSATRSEAVIPPPEQRHLQHVLRAIALSSQPRIFVAVCHSLEQARDLGALLRLRMDATPSEHTLQQPLHGLLHELLTRPPAPSALLLYSQELSATSTDAWERAVLSLNLQRDAILAALRGPLVLFLPRWFFLLLQHHAPDLLSVVTPLWFLEEDRERPQVAALRAPILHLAEDLQRSTQAALLPDGVDLQDLAQRCARAKAPFCLLVLGQAKVGKSQLLNALLGEHVLPVDILQSTSTPIEVLHTTEEAPFLRITPSAGDPIEVRQDLHATLQKIAGVANDERDLPVVQLRDLLRRSEGAPTEEMIAAGLREWEVTPALEPKARAYLAQQRAQWRVLPRRIQLFHPRGVPQLVLVDTPGVYARGGLGEQTFELIPQAGAILLLIHPNDLGDKALHTLVNEVWAQRRCTPRTGRSAVLHLVLTHAGSYNADQRARLLAEVRRLFPEVPAAQVLLADGVLGLAAGVLARDRALDPLTMMSDERFMHGLSPHWVQALLKGKGQVEREPFVRSIEERSGLAALHGVIDRLAATASWLHLSDVLDVVQPALQTRLALLDPDPGRREALGVALAGLDALTQRYDQAALAALFQPLRDDFLQRLQALAGPSDQEDPELVYRSISQCAQFQASVQSRTSLLLGEVGAALQGLVTPPLPLPAWAAPPSLAFAPTAEPMAAEEIARASRSGALLMAMLANAAHSPWVLLGLIPLCAVGGAQLWLRWQWRPQALAKRLQDRFDPFLSQLAQLLQDQHHKTKALLEAQRAALTAPTLPSLTPQQRAELLVATRTATQKAEALRAALSA